MPSSDTRPSASTTDEADLPASIPEKRVDQLLVEHGVTRSRTRAQRLIKKGRVQIDTSSGYKVIKRPSEKWPSNSTFLVEDDPEERYVSRAGLKLEGLLQAHSISLEGMTMLDIGQSTGGFTDCALRYGAKQVIGIEVGHDQLDEQLKEDERVVCLEGVNARELPADRLKEAAPQGFDAAMMDVSFISQTLILKEIARYLPSGAYLFSLVKPQFELTRDELGSKGIVRHSHQHAKVKEKLIHASEEAGFDVIDWQASSITGSDGNQEWMMLAQRK